MISVLLPTRQRVELCRASIKSLYKKARDIGSFEVLIGVDFDDPTAVEFDRIVCDKIKLFKFQRMGYANLHEYYNFLAGRANGDWLFVWNDDCIMLAKNWDEVIHSYNERFALLAPMPPKIKERFQKGRKNKRFKSLFPIYPRAWLDVVGRLGGPPLDTWAEHVAPAAGVWEWVDMDIKQDRPNDEVTLNRSPYPVSFLDLSLVMERNAEIKKIKEFLQCER